jgi:hypothetical protein
MWRYINRRVFDWRIIAGRNRAVEHVALIERIERQCGDPLVAFLVLLFGWAPNWLPTTQSASPTVSAPLSGSGVPVCQSANVGLNLHCAIVPKLDHAIVLGVGDGQTR